MPWKAEKHLHDDEVHHSQLTDNCVKQNLLSRTWKPIVSVLKIDTLRPNKPCSSGRRDGKNCCSRTRACGRAHAKGRDRGLEERLQRLSERQHRVDAEPRAHLGAQERLTDAQIAKESGAAREQLMPPWKRRAMRWVVADKLLPMPPSPCTRRVSTRKN